MAVRGRKAKPTALKLLDGNRGHSPINADEPKPSSEGMLECPSHLSEVAQMEWNRIVPSLVNMGVATMADKTLLEAYCQSYATYREMLEDVALHGYTFTTSSGYVQQRPQVGIMTGALKQMQSICTEFGLTPASRARIHAATGDSKSIDEDPMEALLKGLVN